ncbi:MAG: hypothetical protein JWN76_1217 [Chitinophagaceae bacterium]|nr:hypothetical protein [Chitinophagaceae bacterium]
MRCQGLEYIETERSSPIREINRPDRELMDCNSSESCLPFNGENNSRGSGNPEILYRSERNVLYTFRELR